jgi:signal transduction histidine kinase
MEEGLVEVRKEALTRDECLNDIKTILDEMGQMLKAGQSINFIHSGNSKVLIDRNLLRNIILNLTSNAIKFSPEGSAVDVKIHFDTAQLEISVKDMGIGIAEEDKQHLFKRFFRGRNVSNIQGTGLGLHIIAKYLELLNGSIHLEGALNTGTTFKVIIPTN